MLDNLRKAFLKSGFPDFITSLSGRIMKGLETLLNERLTEEVKVLNTYKHTAPFIDDAVAQAITENATKIVKHWQLTRFIQNLVWCRTR